MERTGGNSIRESEERVFQGKRKISILMRSPRIVSRDGRYVAYDNGIVCDCFTSTEWYAGPNENFSWFEADRWVRSLSVGGGNWSLPTVEQLRGLYRKKKNGDLLTPLLSIQCTDIWSGECPDDASAWGFNFIPGNTFKTYRSYSNRFRVLATRPKPFYKSFQLPEDAREQRDDLDIDAPHTYENLAGSAQGKI
jgi:hypothetical protein